VTAGKRIDVVLGMFDAYNVGDLDAMMEFHSADLEAFPDVLVFPESRPLSGRDEYRSWIEEINSAWIGARYTTAEISELSDKRVLHRGEWGGEGVASGIETLAGITSLWTVRDDLIARIEWFFDHDRALKAAGLQE
jgi:ketosteroid isomerase-like protein